MPTIIYPKCPGKSAECPSQTEYFGPKGRSTAICGSPHCKEFLKYALYQGPGLPFSCDKKCKEKNDGVFREDGEVLAQVIKSNTGTSFRKS